MSGVIVIELDVEFVEVRFVFFVHTLDKLFGVYAGGTCANHNRGAMGVIGAEV
jgi:hypothetical protein